MFSTYFGDTSHANHEVEYYYGDSMYFRNEVKFMKISLEFCRLNILLPTHESTAETHLTLAVRHSNKSTNPFGVQTQNT